MRNIFLFIRRYFNFLLFLILQGISIFLIISYSNHHYAAFGRVANNVTGNINNRYSSVQHYFYLKRTNDSLLKANEVLYNKLKNNFALPDSTTRSYVDSIRIDSILQYRKYTYLGARVVSNSVSTPNNFIVLDRGKKAGIKEGMGVVDPNNAVVGIITETTDDYSVVMSLLHKDSHISGKLKKGEETGTLSWDGKEPNLVSLTNIPKSARISVGDSVITSGFSTTFPKGIMLGRVEGVYKEASSNYYKVKFFTAANFHNLPYAYVIQNAEQDAVNKILEKINKQP